jgi:hypothetical protein
MAKKLMIANVRGKQSTWGFSFYGDPKHIEEWRADGLDVIEIANVIPEWIAELGLTRAWCFAQDVFNFRSPFR